MSGALIPEGVRNVTLTSYAGGLRARGFGAAEILEALREANQQRCDPPLPDIEIRNIGKSAAKWKPYKTGRGGDWQRAVYIPRGCFDPRPAVCGFDPAARVETDTSLGLWRSHKALYAFLAGLFGAWGCHPSQKTIGEELGISQQHVARHVHCLEKAGLLLVEPGAYRHAEKRYACNSYHFVRHKLFADHFTRHGLPVFNDLAEFSHHCNEFSTGQGKSLLENQRLRELLTHRGVIEPIKQWAALLVLCVYLAEQEKRAEIPPFAFETAGFFRSAFGPPAIIHYSPIVQYVECAARCGGARIVYSDGVVKRYECSCGVEQAAVAA